MKDTDYAHEIIKKTDMISNQKKTKKCSSPILFAEHQYVNKLALRNMTNQIVSENHILYLLFLSFLVVGSIQLLDNKNDVYSHNSKNIIIKNTSNHI